MSLRYLFFSDIYINTIAFHYCYMSSMDFAVDYVGSQQELTESVLKNITIHRLQANKPTIILLCGDSGEGKSYTGLSIADIILKAQGMDLAKILKDVVIFTPLEYGLKMDNLFYNPACKDLNVVMLDEAKELVGAKKWFSFVNQTIHAVNAMSRGIKPVVFIIITQYIGDIENATKRTITYYGECARPLHQQVNLRFYRLYKDTRNIEQPKLRKKRMSGVIRWKGRHFYVRAKFKVRVPRKEIIDIYEPMQRQEKLVLIRRRLQTLINEMQAEVGDAYAKIELMANWYVERPSALNLIVETKRNKIKLKEDIVKMHELTTEEVKEFEKRIQEKLAHKGLAEPKEAMAIAVQQAE